MGGCLAHPTYCRHCGTARQRRTRNPDARTVACSGFRVRLLSLAPRNDRIRNSIHLSNSQRSAALFLCGAGYAVVFGREPRRPEENRGRAGRQGSNWTRGPRRLATSRLVEVLCALPFALVRAKRQSGPQVRQTQGVPRAVFVGLLPSSPRWSLLIRVCPLGRHRDMSTDRDPDRAGPLLTEAGHGRQRGPGRAAGALGLACGLDRRAFAPHLRCDVISPATAPRPASGDADQTPLRHRGRISYE
jgi:hypothetical protein